MKILSCNINKIDHRTGGINSFLYEFNKYYDVVNLSFDGLPDGQDKFMGNDEIWIWSDEFANYTGFSISRYLDKFFEVVNKNNIGLILLNDPFHPFVIPVARYLQIPTLLYSHFPQGYYQNNILNRNEVYCVRESDLVVANSDFTKHTLEKLYNRQDIVVAKLGVDKKKFRRIKFENNYRILVMSRFEEYKLSKVIELIERYKNSWRELGVRFTIVGNGGIAGYILSLTRLGIVDVKEVWGVEEKVKILNEHEILLSLPDVEPWGLSVNEGLACGRIVVASETSGHLEQIKDGVNGFLINTKENIEKIFEKIKEILFLPYRKKKEISDNAIQSARDFTEFVSDFDKILQNFLPTSKTNFKKNLTTGFCCVIIMLEVLRWMLFAS